MADSHLRTHVTKGLLTAGEGTSGSTTIDLADSRTATFPSSSSPVRVRHPNKDDRGSAVSLGTVGRRDHGGTGFQIDGRPRRRQPLFTSKGRTNIGMVCSSSYALYPGNGTVVVRQTHPKP